MISALAPISGVLAPASAVLAWTPFLDPLPIHGGWWWTLIVPLSFGVAVVYKAIKVEDMRLYPRRVAVMTAQILLAMVLLAAAVNLFVEVAVPLLGG